VRLSAHLGNELPILTNYYSSALFSALLEPIHSSHDARSFAQVSPLFSRSKLLKQKIMSPIPVRESHHKEFAAKESAPAKQIASTQDTPQAAPPIPLSSQWDRWFEFAFLCILGIGLLLVIFLYWAG